MPSQPNLQLTTLSVTSPQTRNHLTIFQLLSVVCQRYPEKALTIWRCIFTGNALPNTIQCQNSYSISARDSTGIGARAWKKPGRPCSALHQTSPCWDGITLTHQPVCMPALNQSDWLTDRCTESPYDYTDFIKQQ